MTVMITNTNCSGETHASPPEYVGILVCAVFRTCRTVFREEISSVIVQEEKAWNGM